jgi:coenzyme F420-reducing hydrogenase delta subunit/ferredoxin
VPYLYEDMNEVSFLGRINKGPRTGVFICNCNGAIGMTLDTEDLLRKSGRLEGVAFVRRAEFLCHPDQRSLITKDIREEGLDRVVIAACSPRLYQSEFEKAGKDADLATNMVEMANIREQCAWVHSIDRAEANRKAGDLIAMTAAKLFVATPQEEGTRARVKEENCSGCGVCQATCRVNAIKMIDLVDKPGHRVAQVIPTVCEGCGACVAACPSAAMDQSRFSNLEVSTEIDAVTPMVASEEENFPNVVVFTCHWCSYAAADKAGIMRLEMDPHFRTIRTMCSARIDPEWVMRALSRGADGVLILAGKPGRCHYEVGSIRTNRRMTMLKEVVLQLGFDEGRFRTVFIDSDEPFAYQKEIDAFIARLRDIGPSPMRIPAGDPQLTAYQFQGISEANMKARGLL